MLDLFGFIDALLPPKGERDRRWWKFGIILGGAAFVLVGIVVLAGNFRGGY